MIDKKKNQKRNHFFTGSVAVFALFLMFILAITTISIITTATLERKMSISTGNSTTAFQVAESGMENTLQYFKNNFDKKFSDLGCTNTKSIIVSMPNGSSCTANAGYVLNDISSNDDNEIRFKTNDQSENCGYAICSDYISNVKIIKSIGTTKQETRAIEEDVFLGATKLLLHFNGKNDDTPPRFEDSSFYYEKNNPIDELGVSGSGVVSTSTDPDPVKLGLGSANFDGASYLSIPNSDNWNLGDGDFTVDLWVRFSTIAGQQTLMERENSNLSLYYFDGSFYGIGSQFLWTPLINTWYHIALVRQSGTLSMYVDGSPKGSISNLTNIISPPSPPLYIGAKYNGTQFFNGYIDEIRISKGIARWTSNFTPPTAEYWPD